jgi:hypothetical protein
MTPKGRISFLQFRATAPIMEPINILNALENRGFHATVNPQPDTVDAGWVAGNHIDDDEFSPMKNIVGGCILFAMRIDTHTVPSQVKDAMLSRITSEVLSESETISGFASPGQKRDIKERMSRELNAMTATGKHQKSKLVRIMWDQQGQSIYVASSSAKSLEEFAACMRQTFEVTLQELSAGIVAEETAGTNDCSSLRPTAFSCRPEVLGDSDKYPVVPWMENSISTLDYLGNEFLLWLWYMAEENEGIIEMSHLPDHAVSIGNSMQLDCAWGVGGSHSFRGINPGSQPSVAMALVTGKLPRSVGLMMAVDADAYDIRVVGDRLFLACSSLPDMEDEGDGDVRFALEHRVEHTKRMGAILLGLYGEFCRLRLSPAWVEVAQTMSEWIHRKAQAASTSSNAAVAV